MLTVASSPKFKRMNQLTYFRDNVGDVMPLLTVQISYLRGAFSALRTQTISFVTFIQLPLDRFS